MEEGEGKNRNVKIRKGVKALDVYSGGAVSEHLPVLLLIRLLWIFEGPQYKLLVNTMTRPRPVPSGSSMLTNHTLTSHSKPYNLRY
jgi:hypothetical protein